MAQKRREPPARHRRLPEKFVSATSVDFPEFNQSRAATQYLRRRFGLRAEVGRIVVAATGLGGVS